MALLEIRNLVVEFQTSRGPLRAVDGLDLDVDAGEALGIVGESGSGKSITLLAVMGLLPRGARARADSLRFDGRDLLALPARARCALSGRDMAMVFQEPMTSLNPCFTIGFQICEAIRTHEGGTAAAARRRAAELLERVGMPDACTVLGRFPHQLSGGMNQRAMIAMAITCRPRLLLADEPTTALDVTIQAQILDLLADLRQSHGLAMVLVSHDMGVVAETCDRTLVMYAGQGVELGATDRLIEEPRHPYADGLLAALPERNAGRTRLASIPGVVPDLSVLPPGCRFAPRCGRAEARCHDEPPPCITFGAGWARCHYPLREPAHA